MFWIVQFLGTSEQTQVGHLTVSNVIFPVLPPHENINNTGISKKLVFIAQVYLNLGCLSREKDLFRIDLLQ